MMEKNPDTQLLAEYLAQAFTAAQAAYTGPLEGAWDYAWYRVAERAKELRA